MKTNRTIEEFNQARSEVKKQIQFNGQFYSDQLVFASNLPYFHISDEYRIFSPEGLHLIVCVHGLDGNSTDLRLVKTYLELGLPGSHLEFLMSEHNQRDTFSDFSTMTDRYISSRKKLKIGLIELSLIIFPPLIIDLYLTDLFVKSYFTWNPYR